MIDTAKTKDAIAKAKAEIAEENLNKAVDLLKRKLRERQSALTILNNIDREIADLELKIEQGNI